MNLKVPIFASESSKPICVVDSNVPLHIKKDKSIKLEDKWELLVSMYDMVKQKKLIFPEQVHRELAIRPQHPDAPGTWAAGAWKIIDKALATPTWNHLQHAVENLPTLKEEAIAARANEVPAIADPYVVALALTLKESGRTVTVASEDKPVADACRSYEIPVVDFVQFVKTVMP